MSDREPQTTYLPGLRAALLEAAGRRSLPQRSHALRHERKGFVFSRSPRWRAIAMNVGISALLAVVGLTAAGVFKRGSTLGPEVQPLPKAGLGAAIPSTAQLLPIRVSDPAGGLPWGLRIVRTTRKETCVELGRVDYDTIGVLGIDGALGNDGLFHPLSDDVMDFSGCAESDAHGHAFLNVALEGVPTSGLLSDARDAGGCDENREHDGVRGCPTAKLREIYYGLLGPDAVSVTYRAANGRLRSIRTTGSDGAYLIVLPQRTEPRSKECLYQRATTPEKRIALCGGSVGTGRGGGATVQAGAITAIAYRDGRTCTVPKRYDPYGYCPPVGYVAPRHALPAASRISSPIHVSRLPGDSVCVAKSRNRRVAAALAPCPKNVPNGYERIVAPSALMQIQFKSRVTIDSARTHYLIRFYLPRDHRAGCNDGGGFANAFDFDLHAGELLTERHAFALACPGVIRGEIVYVTTRWGAGGFLGSGEASGADTLLVGRFSFRVP